MIFRDFFSFQFGRFNELMNIDDKKLLLKNIYTINFFYSEQKKYFFSWSEVSNEFLRCFDISFAEKLSFWNTKYFFLTNFQNININDI
jgi:hypothetical protein